MNKYFEKFLKLENTIIGALRLEGALLLGAGIKAANKISSGKNVIEIGVLNGRSAIPVACHLYENEFFYAVDPFESIADDNTLIYGGAAESNKFCKNWKTIFEKQANLKIFKMTSKEFDKICIDENFRFISIDGDHSYLGTLLDLDIALNRISDTGLIVVDDVFNQEWPSVSQALHDFLSRNTKLKPAVIGWNKVFLCNEEIVTTYQENISEQLMQISERIIPNFRVLQPFDYFNCKTLVLTNRWGSASKGDLTPEAYQFGITFENLKSQYPKLIKILLSISRFFVTFTRYITQYKKNLFRLFN